MNIQDVLSIFAFLVSVFLVYALEFLLLVHFLSNRIQKKATKHNSWYWALHGVAFVGICCMLYGYFIEPYWIQVNFFTIHTEKLQKAHFRVVHISDLHCDPVMRAEESLVQKVAALKPDIVVFTGDCINGPQGANLFQSTMSRIQAEYGKYAVLGNWDIKWTHIDRFANTGFKVLYSEEISCTKEGESIKILGLSDYFSDFPKDSFPLSRDFFRIFLYHYPDLIENIGNSPVSLYLCGHTHGGQVALPFYGALITLAEHGKKYEAGLYKVGDTTLYVNRGIGMEGGKVPRVRFWARPEIAVFDIVPSKGKLHDR
ncbi:MAG: metallophosphoesterase [Candidatus Brocadiae bacterium]|nr:metallophosphoesterase [Candidatus Brocadiia bacterium]